jgi:SAM-dependent methyltransferase
VGGHDDIVRREFARQAPTFAEPGSFFGGRRLNEWMTELLPLEAGDTVLDVAGGAGHLSRALAARVRQLVVLDITREMLETGQRATREAGIDNVLFVQGDATALPFVDGAFDLVMTRFALHHMPEPEAAVREMARAARAGGHVAVLDMVDGEARHNELERLRDPSHTLALPEAELAAMFERAGLAISARDERDHVFDLEPWLARAKPAADAAAAVEGALVAELDGGEPTGLRPARTADGELTVTQSWVLLIGHTGAA